jgi:hypothetical protein
MNSINNKVVSEGLTLKGAQRVEQQGHILNFSLNFSRQAVPCHGVTVGPCNTETCLAIEGAAHRLWFVRFPNRWTRQGQVDVQVSVMYHANTQRKAGKHRFVYNLSILFQESGFRSLILVKVRPDEPR